MQHLILLHGALGCSQQLGPLELALCNRFQIHRFNFSGHGGLNFSSEFSITVFVNELKYYIGNNIGTQQKVNIFGYSMGGYIAMQLCYLYPGYIQQLITLGTKWDWNATTALQESQQLNAAVIQERFPAFAEQLALRHGADNWKLLLEKTAAMMLELGNCPGITAQALQAVNIPVLLLRGEQDKMVSAAETLATALNLKHGSHQTLPGCKHPLEQVNLQLLENEIYTFLNN
jgi:pimeloyl-ACP methyl ester carboxylesterase